MQNDQEEKESGVEIEADTPIGKLAAKGMRVSDMIALMTLLGVVAIAMLEWQTAQVLQSHMSQTSGTELKFIAAIKDAAVSQRLQTCILAVPQEKRESEYNSPNGFCRQMAALPLVQ